MMFLWVWVAFYKFRAVDKRLPLFRNWKWRNPTMAIACNGDAFEFGVGLGSSVDPSYSSDGVGSDDG
nr:hypothetical protein [Tanacetum cinerariifolium]